MTDKTSGDPGKADASGKSIFAFKTVAATIGGSVLTLAVALAQVSYSNHLEVLHRQGEQGLAVQTQLLDLTGRIANELNLIVGLARQASTADAQAREEILADAEARYRDHLKPLFDEWGANRLLLRNRGVQVYGPAVGRLVYDPTDNALAANQCNVLAPVAESTARPADCGPSMHEEAVRLTALMIGISVTGAPPDEMVPNGFDAAADTAREVLARYLQCLRTFGDPNAPVRCRHFADLLMISIRRLDLVGVARERLANAIMANSRLAG